VLGALGAAAVGTLTLGGVTGRGEAATAARPPVPTVRQYAGELTGTLRYARGGAGGERTAETASFTHAVELTVSEYGGAAGTQERNPFDFVLATTPAVTVPQEGDLNITTAIIDAWAGEIIEYRPAWAVSHDPTTGATEGVMYGSDALNAVWVWWFGISGTVVPEPLAPPSSFSGTVTDDAVALRFDLGTFPPEHVVRADLTATRTR
jgi:hypothetical protein